MKSLLLTFLLTLGLACSVSAQEDWQVADAQNAAELFRAEVSNISLSPDGMMLAGTGSAFVTDHHVGQICVLALATDDETCFSLDDKLGVFTFAPGYNPLVWSPDSTTLLLAENPLEFMTETDLWALDVGTGELTNLTDDGVSGYDSPQSQGDFAVDYFPAYAPDGDIYFFRASPSTENDLNYPLTLQQLAVGAEEPELVTDVFSSIPLYWTGITASPAVSSDGSQLVFPVDNSRYGFPVADQKITAPQNGLWLVDLVSGEVRQLTNEVDARLGLPESYQDVDMQTLHPVWTADGAGIVFQTSAIDGAGTFLYVDVTTGDVSPLVDLSALPDNTQAQEADAPELLLVPQDGAVSADGRTFIAVSYNREGTSVWLTTVDLPPDGSDPEVLGQVEVEHTGGLAVPNLTVSEANNALLGGWLYTFE